MSIVQLANNLIEWIDNHEDNKASLDKFIKKYSTSIEEYTALQELLTEVYGISPSK